MRINSEDIEMKFAIDKCIMLIMKSGKCQMTEVIELPNEDKIRTHREMDTNTYLILETATSKEADMKEKLKTE